MFSYSQNKVSGILLKSQHNKAKCKFIYDSGRLLADTDSEGYYEFY